MIKIKIKNATLSLLILSGMLGGSSANKCRGLGLTDCENTRGCQVSPLVLQFQLFRFGECVPTSCSVLLNQRDCDSVKGCDWFIPATCDGIPLGFQDFAEEEALLSLEAAADDPNDDDYDYDPYGDAPDALSNTNDYSGSGSTRTNLRGWNQDQEQELQ